MIESDYKLIVVGTSSGGFETLSKLFSLLPKTFKIPIICVIHLHKSQTNKWIKTFKSNLKIFEAKDKEKIKQGNIYFAPSNYHLLIENDFTFSLSIDDLVKYSRPSIDVLFESSAYALRDKVIGIILTGANDDGAQGMKTIKKLGGLTIAEDPKTAINPFMPEATINKVKVDKILPIEKIAELLIEMCG